MGVLLCAECECGFRYEYISAGIGYRYIPNFLNAPALCRTCRKLVVLNYLEEEHRCPECGDEVIFYNRRLLQDRTGFDRKKGPYVFGGRIGEGRKYFRLPDVAYLCPQCNEKKMRFIVEGMWD